MLPRCAMKAGLITGDPVRSLVTNMKIIKEGRPQTGWAKEYECTGKGNGLGGCGAILLVEEGDLFSTCTSRRDEVETFITFECPACTVLTDIPQQDFLRTTRLPSRHEWLKRNDP